MSESPSLQNPPQRLLTDRLIIRPLDEADIDGYFRIFSDPEALRYWSSGVLVDRDEAAQKIANIGEHYRKQTLFQLGIERVSDGELVGTCTLWNIHVQNRRAELGYILDRQQWGRGYMNEALTALLDHAFGPMELHRLEADIDPDNVASAKTLERLGFQREGYMRERWLVGDRASDSALYGLLAHEWKSVPSRDMQ